MSTEKACLVTGVGEGTGLAIAKHFAEQGYRTAMLARDADRLQDYAAEIENAHAYPCDISDLDQLDATVKRIQDELGDPDVIVHNAVSASFETVLEGDPEALERNFRVNTTALLYLVRAVAPAMLEKGEGSIIATGNTAAFRGVPSYGLFAPTKAAQRVLLESIARDLGPKGIHAAYINIDAVIDVPWTRDRFCPNEPDDFFITPRSIASEVYHVAGQPRDAWSFNVEIRPFAEKW